MADLFIFYDEVQYTKGDWRNRNLIKVPDGIMWLTVPCIYDLYTKISEVKIFRDHWKKKHWYTILHNYKKASYF